MTQEDKSLLLKDLCARLPYHPWLYSNVAEGNWAILTPVVISGLMGATDELVIKPYLRPMSSMTEEERKELISLCSVHYTVSSGMDKFHLSLDIGGQVGTNLQRVVFYNNVVDIKILDYLNEHHFDYRDLIEKGLAIKAPEGMYNISNN